MVKELDVTKVTSGQFTDATLLLDAQALELNIDGEPRIFFKSLGVTGFIVEIDKNFAAFAFEFELDKGVIGIAMPLKGAEAFLGKLQEHIRRVESIIKDRKNGGTA